VLIIKTSLTTSVAKVTDKGVETTGRFPFDEDISCRDVSVDVFVAMNHFQTLRNVGGDVQKERKGHAVFVRTLLIQDVVEKRSILGRRDNSHRWHRVCGSGKRSQSHSVQL